MSSENDEFNIAEFNRRYDELYNIYKNNIKILINIFEFKNKIPCQYGSRCIRYNPEHILNFYHPDTNICKRLNFNIEDCIEDNNSYICSSNKLLESIYNFTDYILKNYNNENNISIILNKLKSTSSNSGNKINNEHIYDSNFILYLGLLNNDEIFIKKYNYDYIINFLTQLGEHPVDGNYSFDIKIDNKTLNLKSFFPDIYNKFIFVLNKNLSINKSINNNISNIFVIEYFNIKRENTSNKKRKREGGNRTKKVIKVPIRYIPSYLTNKDKIKQKKMLNKSRKLYKKGIYFTRKKLKSFKSKKSDHVKTAKKMFNVDNLIINNKLVKSTGCSKKGLNEIINKGKGAYYSSGSRPNQTADSWGYARLASALTGSKSAIYDYKILEKHCNKSSKTLKLAKKAFNKYKNSRVKKITLK